MSVHTTGNPCSTASKITVKPDACRLGLSGTTARSAQAYSSATSRLELGAITSDVVSVIGQSYGRWSSNQSGAGILAMCLAAAISVFQSRCMSLPNATIAQADVPRVAPARTIASELMPNGMNSLRISGNSSRATLRFSGE